MPKHNNALDSYARIQKDQLKKMNIDFKYHSLIFESLGM